MNILPISAQVPQTCLRILIVDDEANIRKTLSLALELDGHAVTAVSNAKDGLGQASLCAYDLLFLDLRLGAEKGIYAIPEFIASSPWLKIVIITAYASVETAVEAMKRGAVDYLPKPFTPTQVRVITSRILDAKQAEGKLAGVRDSSDRTKPGMDLDSRSHAMQRALGLAKQVAPTETAVLLRGESGTGKGVMSRLIHSWSPRASKPFGVVSCPSLSAELLESELFGHVRGAFTGALRDSLGRIAALDGGTLFLDEIGDLPIQVQPKLLRFLQEKEFERVGENITRKADIRILTATHVDLEAQVKAGKFREDLLYRLNVFQIEMPTLRERAEDIVSLATRFLAFFARKSNRQFLGFTEEAQAALQSYAWPGNIRELQNKIERAAILSHGPEIGLVELDFKPATDKGRIHLGDPVSLDIMEEAHIRLVLAAAKSLDDAARILGIDAATLWRRRKKYQI